MEMLRKLEQQLDAFMSSVRTGLESLGRKPEEDEEEEMAVPSLERR